VLVAIAADDQARPDVAPIHDRQMVVLERADWLAWLDLSRLEAELLHPLPPVSLAVEKVR
jgi:putative SOS response-associated peptidase YedK